MIIIAISNAYLFIQEIAASVRILISLSPVYTTNNFFCVYIKTRTTIKWPPDVPVLNALPNVKRGEFFKITI